MLYFVVCHGSATKKQSYNPHLSEGVLGVFALVFHSTCFSSPEHACVLLVAATEPFRKERVILASCPAETFPEFTSTSCPSNLAMAHFGFASIARRALKSPPIYRVTRILGGRFLVVSRAKMVRLLRYSSTQGRTAFASSAETFLEFTTTSCPSNLAMAYFGFASIARRAMKSPPIYRVTGILGGRFLVVSMVRLLRYSSTRGRTAFASQRQTPVWTPRIKLMPNTTSRRRTDGFMAMFKCKL